MPVRQMIILALIIVSCSVVRNITIGSPQIYCTNWKEIDYLTISQNYLHHGFNLLRLDIFWPAEVAISQKRDITYFPWTEDLTDLNKYNLARPYYNLKKIIRKSKIPTVDLTSVLRSILDNWHIFRICGIRTKKDTKWLPWQFAGTKKPWDYYHRNRNLLLRNNYL